MFSYLADNVGKEGVCVLAGFFSVLMIENMDQNMKVDDPAGLCSIFGVAGILGLLASPPQRADWPMEAAFCFWPFSSLPASGLSPLQEPEQPWFSGF